MIQVPSSLRTWTTGTCGSNRSAYLLQTVALITVAIRSVNLAPAVNQDTGVASLVPGPQST